MSEKFSLNEISGKNHPEKKSYVALRISRANHSCHRNADYTFDDGAGVQVLFATRNIQEGEEICTSYSSACDINIDRSETCNFFSPNLSEKDILRTKWGITCPADCVCKDEEIKALVIKGTKMFIEAERMVRVDKHAAAFKLITEVLSIHDQIESSPLSKGTTHYSAFQIAIMSRKTVAQADQHIRFLCDLYSAVCPYSTSRAARCLELKNNPEKHRNFLIFG